MARSNNKQTQPSSQQPQSVPQPAPATQASAQPARAAEITAEQIRKRAYEIYQARGGKDGQDQNDWFQAERELKLGKQ